MKSFLPVAFIWSLCFSRCLTDEPCLKQRGENIVYIFCTAIPNSSFYSSDVSVISFFGINSFGIGTIDRTIFNSSKLVSVTNLTIASSQVRSIEPGALSAFLNLASMDLDNNQLDAIDAAWFCNPASLVSLSLSRNNIHLISEDTLSLFSSLKMLDLSWNKIVRVASGSFKSNPHLSTLNFSVNHLSFLSPRAFEGVQVREIDLTRNPWNCSCQLREFASFLRDLVNKSVLEKRSAVVCLDPAHLKGIPLWNVSDFDCPVTGTTTVPGSTTGPYEQPPASTLSSQTQLLTVLVLLALVLFFLFLILLLIKRKHTTNPVIPEKENKETSPREGSANENPNENRRTEANISVSVLETDDEQMNDVHQRVKGHANFASGDTSKVPFPEETMGDASASPVKAPPTTSRPLQEGGRHRDSISNITAEVELGRYPGRVSEKQALVLDIKSLHDSEPFDSHTFQGTANPARQGRNEDGKPIGTILPLSKSTNCGMSNTNNSPHPNGNTNDTPLIVGQDGSSRSPLETQSFKPGGDEALYGARASVMNTLDGDEVGRPGKRSQNARDRTNEAALKIGPGGGKAGLVGGRRMTGSSRGLARGLQSDRSSLETEDVWETRHSAAPPEGTTEGMSKRQDGIPAITPPGAKPDPISQATPACEGAFNPSFPTEDQPIHRSEYCYTNLLHEVVENQGRWTRERWKQTHSNLQHKVQTHGL